MREQKYEKINKFKKINKSRNQGTQQKRQRAEMEIKKN